jgi:uncharacterized protein involved in cysteine biosynthesis
MILNAFFSALGQMADPRFRSVLLKGIGLALAVLFAISALFVWGTGWLVGDSLTLPWLGEVTWISNVLSWAMVPVMMVLSVFLMIPTASAMTSLFLEEVAQAVEDRHYPHLGPAMGSTLSEGLRDTLSFLGVMIVANLLALVLYLMFAPFAPFIFWALNGFLLGREYFTLAAMRRLGRAKAVQLRKKHLLSIWAAGILMAVPLSVPLVNLLIPVLGAATFTHIFHQLSARSVTG